MALFGRNDEDEFDEEYDLEEEKRERREERKLTRKFRDLSPENKRKRKEPPKPWGKKERLVVLLVLLVTIITSTILALSARDYNLPGLPKFALDSNSFRLSNPFGEEKILLGGKKASNTKTEDMKRAFSDKVEKLSGTYAFYLIELSSGEKVGIGEDGVMTAASFIKLPVFVALYKEAEKGKIDLETKYALKNSDKRTGSGSLVGKPAGTILTYRDLAKLMGKESDNTAYNILKSLLGDEKIEAVIKEIGMTRTSLRENTTSPKDIGTLFQKLWDGSLVSKENKDVILGYLTDTIYENWIVKGIPPEIDVAHKYGRELHVVNDAGIVMTEKPFIIVLMSKGVVEDQADNVFPQLARMFYEFEK